MRCPSPCWTPMDPSGDRLTHSCPACHRVVSLRDPSIPPAAPRAPASPFRESVDRSAPATDRLREDEKGWPQHSDDVVIDLAPVQRFPYPVKSCPDCPNDFIPNGPRQDRCTACAVLRRRMSEGQRRTTDLQRTTGNRFTAKLLKGAA